MSIATPSHQPTLDRQCKAVGEVKQPEMGEGSEFGRQRREEARRRRRGYGARKGEPDDSPWILKEQKKGGKQLSVVISFVHTCTCIYSNSHAELHVYVL